LCEIWKLNACLCEVECNYLNFLKCKFMSNWIQLLEWNQIWGLMFVTKLLGCKIFHFGWCNYVGWNSMQHQLFERSVWLLGVFLLSCVCLGSLRVKSMPTTNLHVSICLGYSSRQLIDYATNIYYGINDYNLLDLFHHLEIQLYNYLAYNFDS
jgi:hypothetical protein